MILLNRLFLSTFIFICSISSLAQSANALHFDGINDAVNLPATINQPAGAYTLQASIKTSDGSGVRAIVVRPLMHGLFLQNNQLAFYNWNSGQFSTVPVSLNDNQWHHVAVTFNHGVSNSGTFYIDGVAVSPTFTPGHTSLLNNYCIGHSQNGQFFNGSIDNASIHNRILSASEIYSTYVGCSAVSSGLLAAYNFNQGTTSGNNSGITTLTDQSGNNHDGTLSNFALNGSSSNWVSGKTCCFLTQDIIGTTAYCLGQTINLTASFTTLSGESITGYQWKKNGVNLINGGNVTGATSANLQISNIVAGDFDTYSVEVTSTCNVSSASCNVIQSGNITISNLTAYYPFNNTSSDESGNAYNAINSNTTNTSNRFNLTNSAYSFNGATSDVSITAPTGYSILGNGQNKTITLWFKRSSLTSKGILLGYQQTSPGNWNPLAYIGNDGVLRGWMYQGGSAPWSSGITIDTNWHHLALVYTTNTQTAYLDGNQVAVLNGTLQTGASNMIKIGNGYANTGIPGISATGNQPFSGVIDEVRFYNAVLSVTQINTIRKSPFLITNQPQNQSVCIGETANFSLNTETISGNTLNYQWTYNGSTLTNGGGVSGVNTTNLQISNFQASQVGTYTCIISPGCNEATSSSVTLSVGTGNVTITHQPQHSSVCENGSTSFSITTQGGTFTYQWKKNGVNINGATSTTLILNGVSSSDAGNYTVDIIGGSCGTVTSNIATLTVLALPVSTITPTNPSLCQGQSITLTAGGGSTYLWNNNMGTGDTKVVSPASTTSYTVTVTGSNGCQSSTSQTVTVLTTPAPVGATAQSFCSGATVNDLMATGTSLAWYAYSSGGSPLASSDILGTELYYASQTVNGCESTSRLGVSVTVTQVNNAVTLSGSTLTAAQTGANYTWIDCNNSNQPITGATGQSFTPSINGNYAVIVNLNTCSVTSNCINLTAVGVENNSIDRFNVYPNPSTTLLNVEFENISALSIIDISGKVLSHYDGSDFYTIDITPLTPGMYLIKTSRGESVKFIKE